MEKVTVYRRPLQLDGEDEVVGTILQDGTVENSPGETLSELVEFIIKSHGLDLSVEDDWEYLKGRFARAMQTYVDVEVWEN